MPEIHKIDADFTSLHGVIKFRNADQNYFLIAANKAKSNAKGFRQAAEMIGTSDERTKNMNEWLLKLADQFERCEGE